MGIRDIVAAEWDNMSRLRYLRIHFDAGRCRGTWQCYDVCPIGLWTPNYDTCVVEYGDADRCIACGACVLQCPEDAIELKT